MKRIMTKLSLLILLGFGLTGCMVSGGVIIQPEPIIIGKPNSDKVEKHRNHRSHQRDAKKGVRIPPGHMPPRGACRIWYDHRPPGHQPPPGNCRVLRRQVPYNAVLVWG
jgi:hypothetical protein